MMESKKYITMIIINHHYAKGRNGVMEMIGYYSLHRNVIRGKKTKIIRVLVEKEK